MQKPSVRESREVFFALLETVGKGGKNIVTKMNKSAFRHSSSLTPVLCTTVEPNLQAP